MLPDRAREAAARAWEATRALPLLAILTLAGCVSAPSYEEWAEVGFRTPEQTLRSFQLAVRADAPRVEYRCLSADLRRGLPQIAWREAREDWYAENPFLKSGIAKATVVSSDRLSERRHRFVVESYGESFVVELVREDYSQVYADGKLVVDELLPYDPRDPYRDEFSDFASLSEEEGGTRFASGGVTVRADAIPPSTKEGSATTEPPSISELRIGQEWKVDALGPAEDTPDPTGPRAPSDVPEPTP